MLWIDARSPETVRSSFERCAGALRLPVDRFSGQGAALEDSLAIVSVLRWLGARCAAGFVLHCHRTRLYPPE